MLDAPPPQPRCRRQTTFGNTTMRERADRHIQMASQSRHRPRRSEIRINHLRQATIQAPARGLTLRRGVQLTEQSRQRCRDVPIPARRLRDDHVEQVHKSTAPVLGHAYGQNTPMAEKFLGEHSGPGPLQKEIVRSPPFRTDDLAMLTALGQGEHGAPTMLTRPAGGFPPRGTCMGRQHNQPVQTAPGGFLIRVRGGRVVFITSLAENVSGPSQVDYGASKAGLRMTMVGFATALGRHGITCNAVAPGMILTDMTAHHWGQPGPAAEIKVRVPVGRIGTHEDIGHAAVFLASAGAASINGITIRVDGGHQAVCT